MESLQDETPCAEDHAEELEAATLEPPPRFVDYGLDI
jgi:hypothetical protein